MTDTIWSLLMEILIIEDDLSIKSFLEKGFKEKGFTVESASDGNTGLEMILKGNHLAAIIDIMLPGKTGLEIITEMRKKGITTPSLILSAKRETEDKIVGLKSGADDYLVKPFSFSELFVRIEALIRRSKHEELSNNIDVNGVSLNRLSREVYRNDIGIILQPREFTLLELLMRNCGNVLTKTIILEHIWGFNFDPQTNVVDVLVSRLRSKIDKDFEVKLIHTIRGVGYVFKKKT